MSRLQEIKSLIRAIKNKEDIQPSEFSYVDANEIRDLIERSEVTGYNECSDCGLFTLDSLSETQDGDDVCDSCTNNYFTCDHCNSLVPLDHPAYITINEEQICGTCYRESYFTCDICDGVFHDDYYGGDGECQSCVENREDEDEDSVIQDYSTKAENHLPWGTAEYTTKQNKKLFFGMELEVERRGSAIHNIDHIAETLRDHCSNRILLAHDGSLDDGFEIKTPPMSLKELSDIAKEICTFEYVTELRSHDGGQCGLHIHISRDALSQLQQGKIYQFINAEKNKKLVRSLARRYSRETYINDCANYTRVEDGAKKSHVAKGWARHPFDHKKIYSKQGSVNETRYVAVNFTRNTVEIRITRGTLKLETLLACIEWVGALVYFTTTGERDAGNAETQEEFLYWLTHNPQRNSKWKNLTKYLVGKQFLPSTVLPNVNKLEQKTCA